MKAILLVTSIFTCFTAIAQTFSTTVVDSITNSIDKDTSLRRKTVMIDTLYSSYETLVRTDVTFVAYTDPSTNKVHKIIWNTEGDYYCFVTIYYSKDLAIKGLVKAKYRVTDTNPEFETNSVFYYENDEVVEENELNGTGYSANGWWYLSTINDFIALAGIKMK